MGVEFLSVTMGLLMLVIIVGLLGSNGQGTVDNRLIFIISKSVNEFMLRQFWKIASIIVTPFAIVSSSHPININESLRRSRREISFRVKCGLPDKLQPIG